MEKVTVAAIIVCLITVGTAQKNQFDTYQVLMPSGKPAVGAQVKLLLQNSQQQVETTDYSGKFILEITPQQIKTVIVDMPQCAIGVWSSILIGKTFQLREKYSVHGKVIGDKRQTIANALVVVTLLGLRTYSPILVNNLEQIDVPILSCRSNQQGEFTLRGFILNNYSFATSFCVWSTAKIFEQNYAGYLVIERKADTRTITYQTITLKPTTAVRGKIVNALTQETVDNAKISLTPGPNHDPFTRRTNADGTFVFPVVPYTCNSGLVEHRSLWQKRIYLSKTSTEPNALELNFDIYLRPLVRVSGKMIDSYSKQGPLVPLDFYITAKNAIGKGWQQKISYSSGGSSEREQYTTKEDGYFSMKVPVGKIEFEISKSYKKKGPYFYKKTLQISAIGKKNLKFIVDRRPGLLFKSSSNERDIMKNLIVGNFYNISMGMVRKKSHKYADNSQVWFYPTKKWQGKVWLEITKWDNNKEILVYPRQKYQVTKDSWPILVEVTE